jgi:excisionase family DNA binding protein
VTAMPQAWSRKHSQMFVERKLTVVMPQANLTRPRYVKISEAAEYIHCTERTVRQMVYDGRLRAYRSGARLIRLDLNDIDAHLAGAK